MTANNAPMLLVVDDDEDAQTLLRETLEEAGYIVVVGASGEEALQLLDEHGDGVRPDYGRELGTRPIGLGSSAPRA